MTTHLRLVDGEGKVRTVVNSCNVAAAAAAATGEGEGICEITDISGVADRVWHLLHKPDEPG